MNPCKYGQVISTRMPRPFNGERTVSSTMVPGKLDIYQQKNEVGLLSYIKLNKINQRPKSKFLDYKPLEENTEGELLDLDLAIISWI